MSKELIIAISYYGIGGAQRRALELANKFAQKGYSVYIVAVLGGDKSVFENNYFEIDKRVNLVFIPDYYTNHQFDDLVIRHSYKVKTKIKRFKKIHCFFKSFRKINNRINFIINGLRKSVPLRSFLLSHNTATIICFGFLVFDTLYFAVKKLRTKIIYAETNALNKYNSDRFYHNIKHAISKSDALVFQTIDEMDEHNMKNSKKSFVIHNPVKSNLPTPFSGNRNKTIVNFCRLTRQKNLLLLIQAFEKLLRDFPDYKLMIYADSKESTNLQYKDELLFYICNNNLTDSVSIMPPSSDIHNIILESSMFVSSSDYEGISNSMIEAMAIGLPCVCTDCDGGGAREMITDGENGLLVPVGDVEALKNAMIRMITEDGLAEKCGRNSAKIRETHSIDKISEKWLEVINNI